MISSLFVLFAAAASVAYANVPEGCDGQPNTNPIYSGDLQFVSKGQYGTRYSYAPEGFSPPLIVLHVSGSAYEMGQAYGSLLKKEIGIMMPDAWEYLAEQINGSIGWLPAPIRHAIETEGVEFALNLTIDLTRPHTPQHFIDFMEGMGNGTGIATHTIWQIALIPELIKASCTVASAWKSATSDGNLVQLRLLDWTTTGPFQQFPLLLCQHPTEGGADDDENGSAGHSFCGLTWAGLVGSITGVSSAGIGVQEKVWLSYDGFQRADGYPFHFLMQDILQFDTCIDDAMSRVASANRTCSIFLGVGSATEQTAKTLHYSSEYVQIFNPNNYPTAPNGEHTVIPDVLYTDKHMQPSSNPCLKNLFTAAHGSITGEQGVQIAAVEASGDMHAAVYDWGAGEFYVSNASPADEPPIIPAYKRQFMKLNMKAQMFNASLA